MRPYVDLVATGSYLGLMRAVGIKTLKNKLSEYVRIAAAGETVLVTDRDRVVAELSPPSATRTGGVADALLADLVRRGYLSPALVHDPTPPPGLPVAPLATLLEELEVDRAERGEDKRDVRAR